MINDSHSDSSPGNLGKSLKENKNEHITFIISLVVAGIIGVALLSIFADIGHNLFSGKAMALDLSVTYFFYSLRSENLTLLMKVITNLGSATAYALVIPTIAVILYIKNYRWQLTVQASIILITSHLLNIGLKNFVARPRPLIYLRLVDAQSYSFPSGHSMSAMAIYGFLIYLTFSLVKNKPLKWLLIAVLTTLIMGIGSSRIYLGVHYPTDVIAGFAIGLFWVISCITILRIIRFRKRKTMLAD